ncbi:unnamed protein product, partial [Mesorhabditis spiculigera]
MEKVPRMKRQSPIDSPSPSLMSKLASIEEVEMGSPLHRSLSMDNPVFSIADDDDPDPIVHLQLARPDSLHHLARIEETDEEPEDSDPAPHLMSTLGHLGSPIGGLALFDVDLEGKLQMDRAPDSDDELPEPKPKTHRHPGSLRRFLSEKTAPLRALSKKQPRRLTTREIESQDLEKLRRRLTRNWISRSQFSPEEQEPIEEAEPGNEQIMEDPPPRFEDLEPDSGIGRSDSTPSRLEEPVWEQQGRWMNNKEAKSSMITALTAFYCLFVTIFALVLELGHLLSGDEERKMNTKDWIFGLYMYGGALVFFIYMYSVLLLNPKWFSPLVGLKRFLKRRVSDSTSGSTSEDAESTANSGAATIRKVSHTSPSAGSLFLRLGCIAFGVIGLVYYAFLVFLCISEEKCPRLQAALDISAIVFIFIQMHFIFCNWKIAITGAHSIARLGTMHLVAANLWSWIRYILMEEGVMEKEIREVFNELGNKTLSGHGSSKESSASAEDMNTENLIADFDMNKCRAAECILGSLSEVMYTAIVEYSLIGAAVMFIVWRNIGHQQQENTNGYVKRKHQIRVDCSKTTTGLFLGLAFLAMSFTSMVVYYGYSSLKQSKKAAYVYSITDIIQYTFSSIGCGIAIYQMRKLQYYGVKDGKHDKAHTELLDQILLSLGLVGELIYSVAGLVGLTGDRHWVDLAFVLLAVHICRLVQVGLQTFLLYIAGRVRVSEADRVTQPGKQAVTFLLKAGVSEIIIDFYGKRSWVYLVRSFSPLTIFYRFHSSYGFLINVSAQFAVQLAVEILYTATEFRSNSAAINYTGYSMAKDPNLYLSILIVG